MNILRGGLSFSCAALVLYGCGSATQTTANRTLISSVSASYRSTIGPPASALIRLQIENHLDTPIYVAHCDTDIQFIVEQLFGSTWKPWEAAACPAVLQPPVVIRKGESTVVNVAIRPLALANTDGLAGVFRVTVMAYTDSTAAATSDWHHLLPLDRRITEPFRILSPQ